MLLLLAQLATLAATMTVPAHAVAKHGAGHVLVTGGAGFIGSHTCLCLLEAGYEVTVVDNLLNSNEESLRRVRELTGKGDRLSFHKVDITKSAELDAVLGSLARPCDACIHFAGLKAVGESTRMPLEYYENNVGGTLALLESMRKHKIKNIVFSSSATVYGAAESPITESTPTGGGITNAYGRTKYVIEEILGDFARSPEGSEWSFAILRYFNPVGAHPSGRIGEDPNGPPNNLMPFVSQVAVGRRAKLSIFGADYPTPDGTGVRDYIHVMDLARGHLAALEMIAAKEAGLRVYNLGTGKGYSVLEMVDAMSKASGRPIPYEVVARRPGDVATVYADTKKAYDDLGWKTELGLDDMVRDLWAWQSANPMGFAQPENNQPASQDQQPAAANTADVKECAERSA